MRRKGDFGSDYCQQSLVSIEEHENGDEEEIKKLIKPIWKEVFGEKPVLKDLEDIEGNYELFLVAKKDGEIIGTTGVKNPAEGIGQIARVYIKKSERKNGIGKKSMEETLNFCEGEYKKVVLKTDPKFGSTDFYEKFGFKIYGTKNGKIWMVKEVV